MSEQAVDWTRYWYRTSEKLPNEGELVLAVEKFGDRKYALSHEPTHLVYRIGGDWFVRPIAYPGDYVERAVWGSEHCPVPEGWRPLSGFPVRCTDLPQAVGIPADVQIQATGKGKTYT